jgi:hypothetical protein
MHLVAEHIQATWCVVERDPRKPGYLRMVAFDVQASSTRTAEENARAFAASEGEP